MRVSIMGQAAFGEAVLKRLHADGVDIVGVSAPRDPSRPDALWAAAEAAGIPTIETQSLKVPAGLDQWRALEADLCVMAFVTDILAPEVFNVPALGTVQYHPSLLPLHRGSSAMNWAIINRDTVTGLTIFWPDQGIDTGPILLQKDVNIGPEDTVGSLYFEQLFPAGVEALSEAVRLVAEGGAPRAPQDHAQSTYEPPCREEHAKIAWHAPATELHALIRGCNPQPGAWTTFRDEKLSIFDVRLTGKQEPGMPGRVLRVDGDGFEVRLNGGVLRVLRVQPAGGKKVPAAEWAASVGLEDGFRFR
ncbi:MAG TPA: methionyl-tRNA formyltransferase [Tepidiformaceae bacterium]|nr:methionyl-tRNA formyltransferase [Tepidiformaceae bacterium]